MQLKVYSKSQKSRSHLAFTQPTDESVSQKKLLASECRTCIRPDKEVLACTHFDNKRVTMYRHTAGYLSVDLYIGGWSEGHTGGPVDSMWRLYEKQVEYIRQ